MFHRHRSLQDGIVKAVIFGANDGIVTTFAVVAGVSGANLPSRVTLILGIANMVSDAISMGLGDFLGEQSEREFQQLQSHKKQIHLARLGTTSLATFLAFVAAGTLPLLPYLGDLIFHTGFDHSFLLSALATGIALFFVGSLRTVLIKGSWWKNGLQMFLIGAMAAGASYFLGHTIEILINSRSL